MDFGACIRGLSEGLPVLNFPKQGKPWLLPTISIGKVKRAREEKRIWALDSVSKKLQRRRFGQTAPELHLFGQLL
jgi:hypothetical protein